MGNLMKWELKSTFNTFKFLGMLMFMVLCGLVFIGIGYVDGLRSGYEFFGGVCNFTSSIIYIAGAVYAGICITNSFSERRIQATVMAGNSRLSVLISKSISYLLSLAFFIGSPVLITTTITTCIWGIGNIEGSFTREVVLRFFMVILVNVAIMSICILISFLIKSIGVSIGVNVAATIIIYGLAQSLIAVEAAHKILSYTPIGQSFLIFSDLSYANTLKAILVSVITILVFFILTYLSFSKEELK